MDLTGWTYCLTFGKDLLIYGKGKRRVAIDGKSGKEILFFNATTDIAPKDEVYGKDLQEYEGGGP